MNAINKIKSESYLFNNNNNSPLFKRILKYPNDLGRIFKIF